MPRPDIDKQDPNSKDQSMNRERDNAITRDQKNNPQRQPGRQEQGGSPERGRGRPGSPGTYNEPDTPESDEGNESSGQRSGQQEIRQPKPTPQKPK